MFSVSPRRLKSPRRQRRGALEIPLEMRVVERQRQRINVNPAAFHAPGRLELHARQGLGIRGPGRRNPDAGEQRPQVESVGVDRPGQRERFFQFATDLALGLESPEGHRKLVHAELE